QRVRASIDVAQPSALLDGAAEVQKTVMTESCDDESASGFQVAVPRHGEVHAVAEAEPSGITFQDGRAIENEAEVGAAPVKVQPALVPRTDDRGKWVGAEVGQLAVRQGVGRERGHGVHASHNSCMAGVVV